MDTGQISRSVYQPLPAPKNYIRLLEIHSAPDDGMTRCELSMWRIDAIPSYCAIPYTWGDPNSASFIRLNDRDVQVRENCHNVLRQVHQHKRSRYYWIDSLCINQDANYEKGLQVAMMGDIYRNAELVMACVGHHEDDSLFLFEVLNRNGLLFSQLSETYPQFGNFRRDMPTEARARNQESSRAILKWKLSQPFAFRNRLLNAHSKFVARPYFQRVWTLQELFVAKRIAVFCGRDYYSGEVLDGLDKAITGDHSDTRLGRLTDTIERILEKIPLKRIPLLRRLVSWHFHSWNASHATKRCLTGHGIRSFTSLQLFTHVAALSNQPSLRLSKAIHVVSGLECYKPRDRLYGLLYLVD